MKKIVIMKGNFKDFDYDYTWKPHTEEYFEVDEQTYLDIYNYVNHYSCTDYRMFDYVDSATEVYANLLEEVHKKQAKAKAEQAASEKRREQEAKKRAEKSAERKRKQLEKLKKEFGEA